MRPACCSTPRIAQRWFSPWPSRLTRRAAHVLPLCALLLLAGSARCADAASEARTLKDEALAILKANTEKEATPEEYAACLFKLERAQAILDFAGEHDSALAQEVGAALFWARRFSNTKVLAALDKMKTGDTTVPALKPAQPAKSPAPVTPQPAGGAAPEPPDMAKLRMGQQAYAMAERFARQHPADDYTVALRWFQMASQNPGTDFALKALEQAREAWQRFAGKGRAEELPDTPEMALVKQGDELVAKKLYEPAFEMYKSSLKKNETAIAHKRLGKAYYFRAQQLAEELKPRLDAHFATYNTAYQHAWRTGPSGRFFDPLDPGLAAWNRKLDQLRKEGDVAQKQYQAAEQEFRAVLKLSPEQKDFDAAGYLGLSLSVRPFFRMTGLQVLRDFVRNYTPVNDGQRLLYEFCRTEIERLNKGG